MFNHPAQHTAMDVSGIPMVFEDDYEEISVMNVSGIPIVEDEDYEEISREWSPVYTKEIHFTNEVPVPRIEDMKALDRELPELCSSIFNALSSKELEATFQKCLACDLEEAGVYIEQEVEIQLMYKGRRVGSRRADIVLQTSSDGQRVVLELKAVGTLTSEHLKQLQFYMHHMNIDKGYLINFPHDSGFPDIPIAVDGSVFKHEVILGDPQLSDRSTRGKHADATVQIVKVVRRSQDVRILDPPSVGSIQTILSTSVPQPSEVGKPSSPQKSKPISTFVPAVAKSTGKLCLLCTRKQAYCRYHSDKPGRETSCSAPNKAESPIFEIEEQMRPQSRDQTAYSCSTYPAERVANTRNTSTPRTSISSNFEPPIAQSTGRPCKLCTASQKYCMHHSDYNWRNHIPKLDCPVRAGINISSNGKTGISSSVKAGITFRNSSLSRFQVPIAKTTGMPCKLCTKRQAYCHFHISQVLPSCL